MLDRADDTAANIEEKAPLLRSSTESSVTAVGDDMNKLKESSSASSEDDEHEDQEKRHFEDMRIRMMDIGVWRVFYQDKPWSFLPGYETVRKFKEIGEGVPYLWRFMKEIWRIAPLQLILWSLMNIWESFQAALSLWVTAQLLETMQGIILSGKADLSAVRRAFALKFGFALLEWSLGRLSARTYKILSQRISKLCGSQLLDAYTRMDLVTLQRKDVQSKLRKTTNTFLGDNIWREFTSLVGQFSSIMEIASQGYFLLNFFRSQENGWALAAVCVLPQVIQGILYNDEFGGVWFAHAVNKAYLRLRAVGDTAQDKTYFEEIISSGLGVYLQREYHKAMDGLGTVSHSHVYRVLWDERGPWKDLINVALQDVSLIYYLGIVALNPSSFSLTSLTVLRESAQSFAWTIYRVFQHDQSLNEKIRFIQDYYSLLEMRNSIVDGYLPYPPPECVAMEGMKVEFRNVSMKYPKTTTYALKNVSFTIPAGATVILVGANGSGKTTTVSLLSRLLEASSGEILIDDRPISTYQVQSLRDAQAVLRQSYQHFPFSIKENIGIGDPMWIEIAEKQGAHIIEERIMRAAKLGGADEIIEEVKEKHKKRAEALKEIEKKRVQDKWHLPGTGAGNKDSTGGEDAEGWEVNVAPVSTWEGSWQLQGTKLSDMSEEVEKKIELSGGQWQRLALARLFMRAERDQVRLVCSDEPSAALDPKAEYDVFQSLRELRGRKTTRIFITHRFGHLTKHADLILCLKKGELVEAGTDRKSVV